MDKDVQKETAKPIVFETDEFDVESFNVRPLSKGLGFHQEAQRAKKAPSSTLQSLPRPSAQTPQTPKSSGTLQQTRTHSTQASQKFWDQTISQSEISQFYNDSRSTDRQTSHTREEATKEETLPTFEPANLMSRLGAWSLDLSLILLTCASMAFVFFLASGMSLDGLTSGEYLGFLEMGLFGLGLFSLIYIFYFTILDLVATPGKSLMGLKVSSLHSKRPNAFQTFLRAWVSLLSFLTLGLAAFLDFQSKLSDTLVIKDER